MALDKQTISLQTNEIGTVSLTLYKNQFKLDQKP